MTNPTPSSSVLEKPRRRLLRKYRHFGTWRKVADLVSDRAGFPVNVRYPYEFVIKGIVPGNKQIQKALGIPQRHTLTVAEVNKHLAEDSIQDMPASILKYALLNRTDYTPEKR